MALEHYNYAIMDNPPASRNRGEAAPVGHHVRLMPSETVGPQEVVERMHQLESTLSVGTCLLATDTLARALGELLACGHPVALPGIGILQPRLSGQVAETATGLVGREVHVSGVHFTPDSELLLRADKGKPQLVSRGRRRQPSADEVADFLQAHFASHERLTRKAVVEHFGLTRDQALALLRSLVADGRLQACGTRATAHYVSR
ncbi:MAG: hypothetical protein IJ064_04185 [Bacteroidaceae bacterium]|nr:hypothetical protein [Bacteroidaceae bacterium]